VTRPFTPLHDALQALAEEFGHAIVRVVRETSLHELAEAREFARVPIVGRADRPATASLPADARTPAPRVVRLRRTRPVSARREKPAQLELLLDRADAYPDVAIVDPAALLDGAPPAEDAAGRAIAPEEAPEVPPAPETAPAAPAARPAMRPGEELLRGAGGGGIVLRRRRAQEAAG
jgi:hypothetical protein